MEVKSYAELYKQNSIITDSILKDAQLMDKLIDLDATHWKTSEHHSIPVVNMSKEHIEAVILVLTNKINAINSLKESNESLYNLIKDHKVNGKTPSQWVNVFMVVLEERTSKQRRDKARKLKAKLDELRTTEEKKADLIAQLKELGYDEDRMKLIE